MKNLCLLVKRFSSLALFILFPVVMFSQSNTYFGNNALYSITIGTSNSAFGARSLYANTSGFDNTGTGYEALSTNTGGSNNTANGAYALAFNVTGNSNTAVGSNAGSSGTGNSNATAIGYNAITTASNQVVIGNTYVTSIIGYNNVTIVSDGRIKKNIRSEVPGLDFVNLLIPVTYSLNLEALDEIQKSDDPEINRIKDSINDSLSPEIKKFIAESRAKKEKQVYSGFIAQDVEKAAQSVGYDFSGVDVPTNDNTAYGLRYAEFVVPLVKAVQELSDQNNKLQEQVNELSARLDKLESALNSQRTVVIDNSEVNKNLSFSLFPNPANGSVTINYSLNVDAPISFELYNMSGQRLKSIMQFQNQKAGTYNVLVSVGELGKGTYIVKASSGNQLESKQLIINK